MAKRSFTSVQMCCLMGSVRLGERQSNFRPHNRGRQYFSIEKSIDFEALMPVSGGFNKINLVRKFS